MKHCSIGGNWIINWSHGQHFSKAEEATHTFNLSEAYDGKLNKLVTAEKKKYYQAQQSILES